MMFFKETNFKETAVGRIPTDWQVTQLEKLATIKGRIGWRGYTRNDFVKPRDGAISLGGKNITKDNKLTLEETTWVSLDKYNESPEIKVHVGDIIIAHTGSIGNAALIDEELGYATVNPNVILIKDIKINSRFLYYLLTSQAVTNQTKALKSSTTVPYLTQKQTKDLKIPLPPSNEHEVISEILSTVDNAIRKTVEVIAKTVGLKKGLMQQLLTKGIGHAEFKDSKVGRIPKDWKVVKLGDVATNICSGLTPRGGSRTYLDHGIPFIRSQNVLMNELDLSDVAYISSETHRDMERSIVFPGDLLLNITGASIGRVAVFPEATAEANVNQHVCRIRFSEEINSRFASFYLSSPNGQRQIMSFQAGATRQGLNYQQAKLLSLPCPQLSEQNKITEILSAVVSKLDLERAEKASLERIKQGLMDLLLSGKVRGMVD